MKIAIISDIHEDLESLKKAMSVIEKMNVDEIVCLGDIVGFNVPYYNYYSTRNASECIKIIKANCKIVIAGNHDIFEAQRIPNHKAGFDYPDNWYQMNYTEKKKLAKGKVWLHEEDSLPSLISADEKNYLFNLPEYEIAQFGDYSILFSHFLYPDMSGIRADFVMKDDSFNNHLKFMRNKNCNLGFCGHGHIEGVVHYNEKMHKLKPFRKLKIKNILQGFVEPCIAKGRQRNGFSILDIDSMELEVIRLR